MAKKLKIPKRIAGMKVPKAVRKGALGKFLRSSGGQLLIAQAVMLMGAALAAKRVDPDSPAGKLLHQPIESLGKGGATDRVVRAFREGLIAFRAALLESGSDEELEAGAKKKSGSASRASSAPSH